jgi:hypothetical protein
MAHTNVSSRVGWDRSQTLFLVYLTRSMTKCWSIEECSLDRRIKTFFEAGGVLKIILGSKIMSWVVFWSVTPIDSIKIHFQEMAHTNLSSRVGWDRSQTLFLVYLTRSMTKFGSSKNCWRDRWIKTCQKLSKIIPDPICPMWKNTLIPNLISVLAKIAYLISCWWFFIFFLFFDIFVFFCFFLFWGSAGRAEPFKFTSRDVSGRCVKRKRWSTSEA